MIRTRWVGMRRSTAGCKGAHKHDAHLRARHLVVELKRKSLVDGHLNAAIEVEKSTWQLDSCAEVGKDNETWI